MHLSGNKGYSLAGEEREPVLTSRGGSLLGSFLKQMISGMEKIPGGISHAFQEQKRPLVDADRNS